jgi:hypothetical protein
MFADRQILHKNEAFLVNLGESNCERGVGHGIRVMFSPMRKTGVNVRSGWEMAIA